VFRSRPDHDLKVIDWLILGVALLATTAMILRLWELR